MREPATIKLDPDNYESQMTILTGDITTIEMLDMLKAISSVFAKKLLDEYSDITGEKELDDSKIDEYILFLRNNKL